MVCNQYRAFVIYRAYVYSANLGFLDFLRSQERSLSVVGVSHSTGGMLGHAFAHQAARTRPLEVARAACSASSHGIFIDYHRIPLIFIEFH